MSLLGIFISNTIKLYFQSNRPYGAKKDPRLCVLALEMKCICTQDNWFTCLWKKGPKGQKTQAVLWTRVARDMKAPSCSWLYVDVVWGIQVKNMLCRSFRKLGIDQVLRVPWFIKIFTILGKLWNFIFFHFLVKLKYNKSMYVWHMYVCEHEITTFGVALKKSDEKCINA